MTLETLPMKPILATRAAVAVAAGAALAGCTINPVTRDPALAPSVQARFDDTFRSPAPCAQNALNAGLAITAVETSAVALVQHDVRKLVSIGTAILLVNTAIGKQIDQRRCALDRIAQDNHLQLTIAPIQQAQVQDAPKPVTSNGAADDPTRTVGLDVQIRLGDDQFEPGSATLTPDTRTALAQVASQYGPEAVQAVASASSAASASATSQEQVAEMQRHKVLIVGHTDARDAAAGADLATLSQQRAKAIAEVLAQAGVPRANIYYQGAGDALPVAPNATPDGRAANNRVQLIDVPDDEAMLKYLSQRQRDPANYATATASEASATRKPAPRPARAGSAPPAAASVPVAKGAHAATLARPTAVAGTTSKWIDFGGTPLGGSAPAIELGKKATASSFSLLPAAYASEPDSVVACVDDHPHPTTDVRNLATGQTLVPRDYVNGFAQRVWAASVNHHFVAINDAVVPLDPGAAVPRPTLLVYQNYRGDVRQKPAYQGRPAVSVYRGSERVVYRLFVDSPMRCLDLVVPAAQFQGTGAIFYDKAGARYVANTGFSLQR